VCVHNKQQASKAAAQGEKESEKVQQQQICVDLLLDVESN